MTIAGRTCSECGASLEGKSPSARTCKNACRLKRSRRLARANREVEEFAERNNAGAAEVAAIVRREAPDVVKNIMRDQLQPIVREAITEDVLRAISDMVGLTPRAVAALSADLDSENDAVRQRAYSLIVKYTVGHPALVKPAEDAGGQIVVNFGLPRPETDPEEVVDAEPVFETKVCDMCSAEKPADEFAAGSSRCNECFDGWRERIMEQFA